MSGRQRSRWLGWAVSATILVVAVGVLRQRWEAVGQAGGLPGAAEAAVATLCFVGANAVLVLAWRSVVLATGAALSVGTAAWIWALSQLARYSLGAAQVGGRAIVGRRYGLTATTGAVTALVEVGWQLSITGAIALATVPWWLPGARGYAWLAWAGALPVALLVVGLIRPQTLLNGLVRLLALPPIARLTRGRAAGIKERVQLGRATAAKITGLFALNSGLRLTAFLAIFAALGGDVADDAALAVGAAAVGQLVGRLAVFAPGGLGPREAATALVIAPALGGGPALVLVAVIRLLEVVAELVFLGAARMARPVASDG